MVQHVLSMQEETYIHSLVLGERGVRIKIPAPAPVLQPCSFPQPSFLVVLHRKPSYSSSLLYVDFFILRQGLVIQFQLTWYLLCSPD